MVNFLLMKFCNLKEACDVIISEDVLIHPTDTVFGISGRYDSLKAYNKIYSLKERSFDKPLAVLISDFSQIKLFTDVKLQDLETIAPFLSRGMTILLPRKENLPKHLVQQSEFIGLRIPQHKESLELIRKVGPLICTSANISGEDTIKTYETSVFKDVFTLKGALPKKHIPSTILLFGKCGYTLIREGNILTSELETKVVVFQKEPVN